MRDQKTVSSALSKQHADANPVVPEGGKNRDNDPRAYDLTDGAEHQRLFRELRGYLSTCLREHHGTDAAGRLFAADALKEILQRGFTLKF